MVANTADYCSFIGFIKVGPDLFLASALQPFSPLDAESFIVAQPLSTLSFQPQQFPLGRPVLYLQNRSRKRNIEPSLSPRSPRIQK